MIPLKSGNRKRVLLVVLMMIGLFMLTSCAAIQKPYHSVLMKGSIIQTTSAGVYLCVGSNDGASVGQELDVYRMTATGKPKKPSFTREKIGKVKITEIVDEHFATATIISGKANKYDTVELTN